MTFSECNLEDLIFNAPVGALMERGLTCFRYSKVLRQVSLAEYGRLDIVGIRLEKHCGAKSIIIDVYELKQGEINNDTMLQCLGYVKGISEFFKTHVQRYDSYNIRINPILIGSSIEANSNFIYMADHYRGLEIYTYKYEFNGITFNSVSNYSITNNQFSDKTKALPKKIARELITNRFDYSDMPF